MPHATGNTLRARLLPDGELARPRIVRTTVVSSPSLAGLAARRGRTISGKLPAIAVKIAASVGQPAATMVSPPVSVVIVPTPITSPPRMRRITAKPANSSKITTPAEPVVKSPTPPRRPAIIKATTPRQGRAIPRGSDPGRVIVTGAVNNGSVTSHFRAQVAGGVAFVNLIRGGAIDMNIRQVMQR